MGAGANWLGIGQSVRNLIAGFVTAFPEEAGGMDSDAWARSAIESMVSLAFSRPREIRTKLDGMFGLLSYVAQEEQARACALGNPALATEREEGMSKYVLRSVGFSIAAVVGVFVCAVNGVLSESVARACLYPGILLAHILGFGAHDLGAYVFIFLGSVSFYSAFVLLLTWFVARRVAPKGS